MNRWEMVGEPETYRTQSSVEAFNEKLSRHLRYMQLKPACTDGLAGFKVRGWRPGLEPFVTIAAVPASRGADVTFAIYLDTKRRRFDRAMTFVWSIIWAVLLSAYGVAAVWFPVHDSDLAGFIALLLFFTPVLGVLLRTLWKKTSVEAEAKRHVLRLILWRELDVRVPKRAIDGR